MMPLLDTTSALGPVGGRCGDPCGLEDDAGQGITAIYEEHFEFVWRSLRRLGVPPSAVDDATQDVFVVVHRRLREFDGKSRVKTWLFSIALNVALHHRRTLARRQPELGPEPDEELVDLGSASPQDETLRAEAARLVHSLLESLDDEKRAVLVLAHLEQMPAPEIAEALGIPLNTVYSRLRLARRQFDAALRRHDARERR
jgi:RNA polymerase sigma-70 factor (ECF subfamily)